MEALQSVILRIIVNVLWYMGNEKIRSGLMIKSVEEEIKNLCNRNMISLENHPSDVANNPYLENLPRRLRRTHPNDLHPSA
jgi:hypothetical protein